MSRTNSAPLLQLSSRLAAAAAWLCAAACSAHVEVPNITLVEPNVAFSSDYMFGGKLTSRFDHPDDITFPEYMSGAVNVTAARLSAQQGVDDLAFIRRLDVVLHVEPPGVLAPVRLARYERAAEEPTVVLHFDPDSTANVLEHWRAGAAYYEILLEADSMPVGEWFAEVAVEFSGNMDVKP